MSRQPMTGRRRDDAMARVAEGDGQALTMSIARLFVDHANGTTTSQQKEADHDT